MMTATPIQIEITNNGKEIREFSLFGSSVNLSSIPNFGNHEDLEIKCLNSKNKYEYQAILFDLLADKWFVRHMRVQSASVYNLKSAITILDDCPYNAEHRARGGERRVDLSIMADAYMQRTDIIDVSGLFVIDKRTFLTGTIAANSSMTITFYPSCISSVLLVTNEDAGIGKVTYGQSDELYEEKGK